MLFYSIFMRDGIRDSDFLYLFSSYFFCVSLKEEEGVISSNRLPFLLLHRSFPQLSLRLLRFPLLGRRQSEMISGRRVFAFISEAAASIFIFRLSSRHIMPPHDAADRRCFYIFRIIFAAFDDFLFFMIVLHFHYIALHTERLKFLFRMLLLFTPEKAEPSHLCTGLLSHI